jgi:carbon monoxide dehydrogenase subunit G
MKLEQSFEVHAPIDTVWSALNDLERVAPCLPGAAITGHDDDGTYHGEFKVKLGPTTAAYKGTIKIENADESTHTATLAAKGTDKRGQGGANATIVNTLHEIDGGTRVDAVTDFAITGRLARFGRGGMIQDISNRLLRDFATCLATRLGEGAPSAPSGAEVTSGEAAPEAVAAAAPEAGSAPDAAAAAASAATATDAPPADLPPSGPNDAPSGPVQGGPPPATAAAGGPSRSVAPPPPANEPLKAGSLFWSVMWERIKRFFGGGKKS